ncbi:hypothetical protein [Puniceibacterium confluentis]
MADDQVLVAASDEVKPASLHFGNEGRATDFAVDITYLTPDHSAIFGGIGGKNSGQPGMIDPPGVLQLHDLRM